MGVVIDTNVFIDAENGRLALNSLDALSVNGDAYVAAITISELLTGVHLANAADIRIQRSAFVEGIIAKIPVLEFNEEVARCYGEIYAHFLKPRVKANVHDLQIAATCIAHGFAVLTNNVSDFKKVPGLNIIQPQPEET
ncbi:MAG: type II toxin-antitoxin system VapC family toxin [Gammaproteobacteria bacterium]